MWSFTAKSFCFSVKYTLDYFTKLGLRTEFGGNLSKNHEVAISVRCEFPECMRQKISCVVLDQERNQETTRNTKKDKIEAFKSPVETFISSIRTLLTS